MATMNVKDAAGATVAVEKPLVPGQAAMAASRPVVLASDQSSIPVASTLAAETTKVIGTVRVASGGVAAGSLATGSAVDGWDLTQGAIADAASATGSISAKLRAIATALGVTAFDLGSGTGGSRTLRTFIDPGSQNANGSTTDANSTPTAWSTEGKAQLGAVGETAPASDTASSGLNGRLQRIAQRLTSMLTSGLSSRAFSVAFATLTRPANTTAYTAADSISDNATAGSVTALVSGNISDTNNDPIFISDILVNSTDTGLAGKKIRAYIYNSDPTASTGVGGGDNAAFANKKAGYVGSFMGWMETGFSDGTVGRLVPCFNETNNTQAGGFIAVPPVSGARTLYIQYQAVEAFTPSANSTTIIGTARGWQGRAV